MKMKEEIFETIKGLIKDTGKIGWTIPIVRAQIIEQFGKKSLTYNHVWEGFFGVWSTIATQQGWVLYDEQMQKLVVNQANQEMLELIKEVQEETGKCSEPN